MSMDNSSGRPGVRRQRQMGDRSKVTLLLESYGKCTLFDVMMEEVDGVAQAGMVQFPLKFYIPALCARVFIPARRPAFTLAG